MWHFLKRRPTSSGSGRLAIALQGEWLTGSVGVVTPPPWAGCSNAWNAGTRLYCTDDWAAYAELIPQGRLYVGKDQTHGIERDHSRQRHWPARFRRRTCVVSKAKRMVDASIALFVRFGDLGGVNELLSMLAYDPAIIVDVATVKIHTVQALRELDEH